MDKYFEMFLEEKFKSVAEAIGQLKTQQNNIENKINDITETIEKLKLSEALHFSDCPNTPGLADLKKKIDEFLFIKKYWKVFLIAAVVFLMGSAYTIIEARKNLKDMTETVIIESKKIDTVIGGKNIKNE